VSENLPGPEQPNNKTFVIVMVALLLVLGFVLYALTLALDVT
jgi:hypothetical protein